MRILAVAAAFSFMAPAMSASQAGQCVNPQMVNGLVFLGRSDMKVTVTRELPSFMENFRAPAGFSLIGTGVQAAATKVSYKTPLPGNKTYAALVSALSAEGWTVEIPPYAAVTFNVPAGAQDAMVCRNGDRRSLRVAEFAGGSYATIIRFSQTRPRDCNTPDPAMQMGIGATLGAIPRLQMPAGTMLAQGNGGGGGSSGGFTISSRIISGETHTALVEYLAGQMVEQGWQRDAQWAGSRSAGSTWRKSQDGASMSGTLEIVRVSEKTYDVDFTTVQPR